MKKKLIYILGTLGILAVSGAITTAKAQTSNVLQEVKLNPNDGFNDLRKLVIQNFDFTNPDLSEGEIDSLVKFDIAQNGKISNVNVNGECKYVSKELENVLTSLQYKFNPADNRTMAANTYSFPVKVIIDK